MSMTWWNCHPSRPWSPHPVRPVDDGAITRPAPMRGDLLGPLVRRIHGVRPTDRVVIVGVRSAQLVEI